MLFKYPLTDSQYARFQHDNNNAQIQSLGRKAGVEITDERVVDGIETMYFRGRCSGTMALVPCDRAGNSIARHLRLNIESRHHWECWIQVRKKPLWLPRCVLDWGFRAALK